MEALLVAVVEAPEAVELAWLELAAEDIQVLAGSDPEDMEEDMVEDDIQIEVPLTDSAAAGDQVGMLDVVIQEEDSVPVTVGTD